MASQYEVEIISVALEDAFDRFTAVCDELRRVDNGLGRTTSELALGMRAMLAMNYGGARFKRTDQIEVPELPDGWKRGARIKGASENDIEIVESLLVGPNLKAENELLRELLREALPCVKAVSLKPGLIAKIQAALGKESEA